MRSTVGFEMVKKIGLTLAGVEAGTAWGSPALKVKGKLMACLAIHRSAEPGSLVVSMDFSDRNQLLAEAPETYYLTDHYVAHPCVLVRLSRVTAGELRDLLGAAHKFVSASAAVRSGTKRRKPGA